MIRHSCLVLQDKKIKTVKNRKEKRALCRRTVRACHCCLQMVEGVLTDLIEDRLKNDQACRGPGLAEAWKLCVTSVIGIIMDSATDPDSVSTLFRSSIR